MSLDELEEQVERLYIDMENELLLNIAKKLSQGKPMGIDKWDAENNQPLYGSGGVNEWQLERLRQLNGLNEENAKIIAKYSGKTIEEVEKVFNKAKEIGQNKDKGLIEEGVKKGLLNEIDNATEDALVNNILSTAMTDVLTTFNRQNNSILMSAGDEYVAIVNKVSSQVLAGTKTTAKAMQEAVSQFAEKGLTGFTARNGAEWTPEAYTKMVIRTNTQNTINRIQDERIQACGGDFIEISSHIGARPLCAQDQGQIFSLSGYSGYIEDLDGGRVKVRPWSSSTYGKPAGIFGINCRHSRYMFVPGLSKKREMDFTKKENDKIYAESQRQRQYERTIRNKKREIAMLKQTGAEPSYIKRKQNSLSDTRKEYLKFLDKTGRTRITANEWIGSTSLSPKTVRKTRNNLEKNIFGKSIDYSKLDLSNKKVQELKKDLDNLTRQYNTRLNSVIIKSRKEMRASGTVDIAGNMELSQIRKTTVYHEFFHSISQTRLVEYDLGNKYDKQFWEEANKLFKNYKKEINYLQKNNPLKIYDIKISDYSLTNVDEFMAEGFARAMLEKTGEIAKDLAYNSEKMSPYAIKILDLINKYYKK